MGLHIGGISLVRTRPDRGPDGSDDYAQHPWAQVGTPLEHRHVWPWVEKLFWHPSRDSGIGSPAPTTSCSWAWVSSRIVSRFRTSFLPNCFVMSLPPWMLGKAHPYAGHHVPHEDPLPR